MRSGRDEKQFLCSQLLCLPPAQTLSSRPLHAAIAGRKCGGGFGWKTSGPLGLPPSPCCRGEPPLLSPTLPVLCLLSVWGSYPRKSGYRFTSSYLITTSPCHSFNSTALVRSVHLTTRYPTSPHFSLSRGVCP